MKNQYFIITFFALLLFANNSLATDLRDAIDSSKANNRNIKLERIRLNSIKTEKTKAIAEFLPNIKADIGYGQRNSFYQGQEYDRSTKQRSKDIILEQPVFDGLHSVSKYKQANYKIQSSTATTHDKTQEISFSAVQSYCNLFRYSRLIKLQEENKKLGRKFLDLVNRRKEARIIDKSDIIKFSYEASLNDEKYLDITSKLNKAKFDYQNVVGHIDSDLSEPQIIEEQFDAEKILEAVLEGNHKVQSYRYKYLASKAGYNAEKSAFSPKVSVTAYKRKDEKVVYLDNQDLNSSVVMLNVTIPIFQKGVEYANLGQAKYEKEAAAEEYEIAKETAKKEVNQAVGEYRFFLDINKTHKRMFELSLTRAEIFNKRLASKVEDPIEVIRAKIEANERRMNYINSRMDLVIIYYKIKYFLGEI
ncbi:MAG: TolC family protein [Rickettsiales bacterium]|nr:TolC family protein [Rickettsiales bacterium]